MERYIYVTIIDEEANFTSTQIWTNDARAGIDFVEHEQSARNGIRRCNRPLVAAFIFDTGNKHLTQYIIDGLRAKLVTKEMFR